VIAFFAELPPGLRAVLEASAYASALVCVVYGVQALVRRALPARFVFALWLLVFVRLSMIPLPASALSVFNLLHQNAPAAVAATVEPKPVMHDAGARIPADAATTPARGNPIEAAPADAAPVPAKPVIVARAAPAPAVAAAVPAAAPISIPAVLAVGYACIAAFFLLRLGLASVALRRVVRRAELVTDPRLINSLQYARLTLHVRRRAELRLTDALEAPAITGVFRPCLLLPRQLAETLSPGELTFVFLHEYAHLRRGDVLLNCWWAMLQAMHWFNPLVWLLGPRIRADRELACDELVLRHTADAPAYGHTLLKILELLGTVRRSPVAVGIIESRSSFTGRIQMIAKYRKHPVWMTAAATAGVLALACVGLTNPVLATTATPAPSPAPAALPAPANTPEPAPAPEAPAAQPATAAPSATAIEVPPQAGGTWHMEVNGQPIPPEKMMQLRKQIEDLNQQLGTIRATSSNGAKDVAGIVTTLVQAQRELAGQMMDMEKQLALTAIQSPAALDGNGKEQPAVAGGGMPGSQDPVMDSLVMTRNSLLQDIAGIKGAGGENTSQKVHELDARLSEIERQIADLKTQRLEQANAAAAQATPTRSRGPGPVANATWTSKAFQLKNGGANEIVRVLQQTFSGAGASISSDTQSNSIVVRGPEKEVDAIEQVVKSLDVPAANKGSAVPQAQTSFSVRDLVGAPEGSTAALTADQRAAENELEITLKQIAGPDAQISTFNGSIIFRGSQKDLDAIAMLIDDLRLKQSEIARKAKQPH